MRSTFQRRALRREDIGNTKVKEEEKKNTRKFDTIKLERQKFLSILQLEIVKLYVIPTQLT